jgi:uncharacterized protein (DUF779 family)
VRNGIRIVLAIGLCAGGAACGGEPEPPYRWEEETIYEDAGRAPEPRPSYEDREDRDEPRSGGSAGHYGRRPRDRGTRGAIYSPKRGVFCDESVASCYVAKNAHVGATEAQFGEEAGERLARRLKEGERTPRGIFRPAGGVVCDRESEVCYDREGASLELTRREFGHGASEDLADRLDEPRRGPGRRGGVIYSPRRGVSCDEQVAACYVEDEAHPGHTKQQFGEEAARALERRVDGGRERRDAIYRPVGGAVCDRLAGVCYDRHGASAKLTREEFGREAAARMTERLE